jgi:short-subunit dehydrogenase
LAVGLAGEGARLILTARNVRELERTAELCRDAGETPPKPRTEQGSSAETEHRASGTFSDGRVKLLPGDLADLDSLSALAEKAEELFGRIDVLVNNAGISQRSRAIETSAEVEEKIAALDFWAPVRLSKAVLPGMVKRKAGMLVIISSLAGIIGSPLRSSYSASKFALHGYFDSLRTELGRGGPGVLLVVPGFVRTEISRHALQGGGGPYGKMDRRQEEGMPVEQCAAAIIRAVKKDKRRLYTAMGVLGRAGMLLKAVAPSLLERIIR